MTLLEIHEPGETPLPHADERGLAVGIDLGTTNTVVAIARDGKPEAIRNACAKALIPSVVAYVADGRTLVGDEARGAMIENPACAIASVKRLMGRSGADVARSADASAYAVEPDDGRSGMVRIRVGGRARTPVEVSAEILKAAKRRAEEALERKVERAVVTVPAYFDDAARTATRDAARVAGLEVLRLVNEPTAAALAYGLDKGAEGAYAIYDLGGGTFDFSLLRLENGVFQVLATGGDAALGGDDIDSLLAARLLDERKSAGLVDPPGVATARPALLAARELKEALSASDAARHSLTIGGATSAHAVARDSLEELAAPLVSRTVRIALNVLGDAQVAPAEVHGVVLVGGSTRMPFVRRQVEAAFGKAPLVDIDPDEVVALGAALQAEALTSDSDMLLLDVAPLSLGIETMGGLVEKIVPRNTPIPVALAQEFTTYQDGQNAMSFHVVQGERELAGDCRSLARFELSGIPPMTAGAARIRVVFAVDADGLLTVSAREQTTGVEQRVEVKPSYGIEDEEMARMLFDSLENAEEDMRVRLLGEARVDAERLRLAVDSALEADGELLSADERADLDVVRARVIDAVAGDDRDAIVAAAEALEAATRSFAERRMDKGIRSALSGLSVDRLEATVR